MHRIKGLPYKVSRVPSSSRVMADDFSIFKWVWLNSQWESTCEVRTHPIMVAWFIWETRVTNKQGSQTKARSQNWRNVYFVVFTVRFFPFPLLSLPPKRHLHNRGPNPHNPCIYWEAEDFLLGICRLFSTPNPKSWLLSDGISGTLRVLVRYCLGRAPGWCLSDLTTRVVTCSTCSKAVPREQCCEEWS